MKTAPMKVARMQTGRMQTGRMQTGQTRAARLLLLVALPIMAVLAGSGAARAAECSADMLDLRGPWGQARFQVELADDDAERARGLMFRESIAASAAMLFAYDRPGAPAFWMKNTLIPLDMLFITPEGVVQFVQHEARPGDLTPISGGQGVQYVLEIKGGMAAVMGIAPGSQVRHPAIDQSRAAWPCAE